MPGPPAVLFSEEAQRTFVAPDLDPIPLDEG